MATKTIEIYPIDVKYATVKIQGDSDLVLNKKPASVVRELTADDRKKQHLWEQQHKNIWEDIITSIHWRDGIPIKGDNSDGLATNRECCQEMFEDMLKNNAPCISAFGMKKSWGQALVQNKIDKYSTGFCASVNIVMPKGLIPIKFASHFIDTLPMNPPGQRGSAVTVNLSHFSGWSADVNIGFTEHVYSLAEIVTIIKYAGFGKGVGSGTTSGFGRYSVVDVVS